MPEEERYHVCLELVLVDGTAEDVARLEKMVEELRSPKLALLLCRIRP